MRIRALALFIALSLLALALAGCSGQKETIHEKHDEALITEGDALDVTLTAIPEGHDASEYEWRGDFEGDPLTGSIKPTKAGKGSIAAWLITRKTDYCEYFPYIAYPSPAVFEMDQPELVFVQDLQGMEGEGIRASYGAHLTLNTDVETAGTGMKIAWESSDPEVVSVQGVTPTEQQGIDIAPHAQGSADITARLGGAEAVCHVTVKENIADAQNVLEKLGEYADRAMCVNGRSAFVSAGDIGCTLEPSGQPGGGGKLMVQVDLEYNGKSGNATDPDDGGGITGPNSYTEYLERGCGFTSLLPKSVRAASMDEVSQIIRVSEGEKRKGASFTGGVQGWERVVNIERVDALTGEVLETCATLNGELDERYWVMEDEKNVTSDLPRVFRVINALYDVIAPYWLEEYDNVSFYSSIDAGKLFRYYGRGEVAIPAELGVKEMNCKYIAQDIDGFAVPDGVEIVYWYGWKGTSWKEDGFRFRVAEGSPAEDYCKKQDIAYTLLEE